MTKHTMAQWEELGAAYFSELATEHGTPFYLYDTEIIKNRIESVREAFDNNVEVYYAVKANPNLELLREIRDAADGLDISSAGELDQALQAGYSGSCLSFAGPAKSRRELNHAITSGVGHISVESPRELEDCVDLARQAGSKANVLLRVNPSQPNRGYGLKMGGRAVQFGVDEEHIHNAADLIHASSEHLNFRGIHVYAGSQGFDAELLATGVRDTLRIAVDIEREHKLKCEVVNVGGGFGVSHKERGVEADVVEVADALRDDIAEFASNGRRKVIFELGRYLCAEAGIYVCRVISSKQSRGKEFFMLDGGLHHHLSAAGTFGTALRSNFVVVNLSRPDATPVKCNLAGPSCNPTDLLGVGISIPRPENGDLLGVLSAGSYGLTASPMLFLGRRTPAELVRTADTTRLARRAYTMQDFN